MITSIFLALIAILILNLSYQLFSQRESVALDSAAKKFELLKSITEKAVSHVNQVAMDVELDPEEKKALAIDVSKRMLEELSFTKVASTQLISDLIESAIWDEEEEPEDEEADF